MLKGLSGGGAGGLIWRFRGRRFVGRLGHVGQVGQWWQPKLLSPEGGKALDATTRVWQETVTDRKPPQGEAEGVGS